MPIRVVATDLDGTLLRDDRTVSDRTRAALDAVRRSGVLVVPVTARQPVGLRALAGAAGFAEWAVCANGALAVHLGTGERVVEELVPVAAQERLAAALALVEPGLLHVSVRDGGEGFYPQEGYADLAHFDDHSRDVSTMGRFALADVLARPSLKLIVRHPTLSAARVTAAIVALGHEDIAVTHSGAPFAEVMAPGVSKAWGIARLCERIGVSAHEVLAFGDAPNDVEMLAWAGRGVAVGNACEEVLAVADEVAPSNEDDGVAVVLEQLVQAR